MNKIAAATVAAAGVLTGLVASRRAAASRAEADLWAEATDAVTTPSAALDSRPVDPPDTVGGSTDTPA